MLDGVARLRYGLVGLLFFAGCFRSSHTEIRYPTMVFNSPRADGNFQALVVLNPVTHEVLNRADLPRLYIRLDGKAVLFLPDLNRDEAAKHFQTWPAPGEQAAVANPDQDVFIRKHQGKIILQLSLNRLDDVESVHFSVGDLAGFNQDPGVEIASHQDGPFCRFPLSRANIVDMFGAPSDEFTRPYPYAN